MNCDGFECYSRTIHYLSTGSSFCYPQVRHYILATLFAIDSPFFAQKNHSSLSVFYSQHALNTSISSLDFVFKVIF